MELNQEQLEFNRSKLITKLSEEYMKEHQYDATFMMCFNCLIRGADPYDIIKDIIDVIIKQNKILIEYATKGIPSELRR